MIDNMMGQDGSSSDSHMAAVPLLDPILTLTGTTEEKLLEYMAYVMILVSSIVFTLLQLVNAPYGRYSNTAVWGFGLPVRVAWVVQEIPSFIVPVLLVCCTDGRQMSKLPNVMLLSMYITHYFQRTFIFSLLIRGGKQTPLIPFLLAFIFCIYNGFMQGRSLTQYEVYTDAWLWDPRFIIGMCMFICGMIMNIHSDYILRNLRKPGETGYKIPTGGMFDYVSGANFLGETTEWVGYAIACWNLPAFAFAIFTLCNLGPRAYHHHRYYLQKFEDYPKERKILIPFLL